MNRKLLILFAATFSFALSARADTVSLGDTYSGVVTSGGATINNYIYGVYESSIGGNLTGSTGTIGGDNIGFSELYCVDLLHDVGLGATYAASYTTNGTIQGGTPVNNAGQIAWLVENLGPSAATEDENLGLQAAIWQVEYGSNFVYVGSDHADVTTYFDADLAALGNNTAPVDSLVWISPTNDDGSNAQGLAGVIAPTPEPSSLMLLGTGLVGVAGVVRKRLVLPTN